MATPQDSTFLDDSAATDSLTKNQLKMPESDLTAEQSIMWYGITSIVNALLPLVFYLVFNKKSTIIAGYY